LLWTMEVPGGVMLLAGELEKRQHSRLGRSPGSYVSAAVYLTASWRRRYFMLLSTGELQWMPKEDALALAQSRLGEAPGEGLDLSATRSGAGPTSPMSRTGASSSRGGHPSETLGPAHSLQSSQHQGGSTTAGAKSCMVIGSHVVSDPSQLASLLEGKEDLLPQELNGTADSEVLASDGGDSSDGALPFEPRGSPSRQASQDGAVAASSCLLVVVTASRRLLLRASVPAEAMRWEAFLRFAARPHSYHAPLPSTTLRDTVLSQRRGLLHFLKRTPTASLLQHTELVFSFWMTGRDGRVGLTRNAFREMCKDFGILGDDLASHIVFQSLADDPMPPAPGKKSPRLVDRFSFGRDSEDSSGSQSAAEDHKQGSGRDEQDFRLLEFSRFRSYVEALGRLLEPKETWEIASLALGFDNSESGESSRMRGLLVRVEEMVQSQCSTTGLASMSGTLFLTSQCLIHQDWNLKEVRCVPLATVQGLRLAVSTGYVASWDDSIELLGGTCYVVPMSAVTDSLGGQGVQHSPAPDEYQVLRPAAAGAPGEAPATAELEGSYTGGPSQPGRAGEQDGGGGIEAHLRSLPASRRVDCDSFRLTFSVVKDLVLSTGEEWGQGGRRALWMALLEELHAAHVLVRRARAGGRSLGGEAPTPILPLGREAPEMPLSTCAFELIKDLPDWSAGNLVRSRAVFRSTGHVQDRLLFSTKALRLLEGTRSGTTLPPQDLQSDPPAQVSSTLPPTPQLDPAAFDDEAVLATLMQLGTRPLPPVGRHFALHTHACEGKTPPGSVTVRSEDGRDESPALDPGITQGSAVEQEEAGTSTVHGSAGAPGGQSAQGAAAAAAAAAAVTRSSMPQGSSPTPAPEYPRPSNSPNGQGSIRALSTRQDQEPGAGNVMHPLMVADALERGVIKAALHWRWVLVVLVMCTLLCLHQGAAECGGLPPGSSR